MFAAVPDWIFHIGPDTTAFHTAVAASPTFGAPDWFSLLCVFLLLLCGN